MAYAKRLQEAGVEVTLEVVEGGFHGFDRLEPEASISKAFFDAQVAFLEAKLG